jgi:hypothetical protein
MLVAHHPPSSRNIVVLLLNAKRLEVHGDKAILQPI